MTDYKKIVPCLDVKDGRVVKGIQFVNLRDAGDPVEFAQFYEQEGADVLVFLDITATVEKRKTVVELVKKVADGISIPFAVGGGIASLEDASAILDAGADKVSLNSAAVRNPPVLSEISKEHGSERLVCAIDVDRVYVENEEDAPDKTVVQVGDKKCWFDVLTHSGTKPTGKDAIQWAMKVKELGAGEILPTSKTFDGAKNGFDLEMTRAIAEATGLPITASGGAGTVQHMLEAFTIGKASAALAASIFHFREITIKEVKEYCAANGIPMKL
ncbi:MAG: imidazole glycerol phosphate synthase subunit HisF [Candidatus Hodarchaeota archaeon]